MNLPATASRNEAGLDTALLDELGGALSRARAMKRWSEACEAAGVYPEVTPLVRTFNPAIRSYGFFGEVDDLPVMGVVQEMPYDWAKFVPPSFTCAQLREFVLRYFMRISDFRPPSAYAADGHPAPPRWLRPLSWCPQPEDVRSGFGFEQLFGKVTGGGPVVRFEGDDRFSIADLRQLGPMFDWLLLQVRIYDFVLRFQPFGVNGPGLSIPLNESNYLLMTPDFITDDMRRREGRIGRFGFGYALLKTPGPAGILAYGPGRFRAGVKNFEFTVLENGSISVRMMFVVDRPERILNFSLDPADWINLFSGSLSPERASRAAVAGGWLPKGPGDRSVGFDPLLTLIDLTDTLTAGYSSNQLCISKRQLEIDFLVHHFMQHYQLIVGSLSTWSQVPDWTNPNAVPTWMHAGMLP